MHEFLVDVSRAQWWISVVVVGLLINIAASYIRPLLDRAGGAVSARWRSASEKRQLAFEAAVAEVRESPELRPELRFEALYGLVRALVSLVVATGCMIVSVLGANQFVNDIFTVFGIVLMAIAFAYLRRCDSLRAILSAAKA